MAQIPSLVDLSAAKYCESYDAKSTLIEKLTNLPQCIFDLLLKVHAINCIYIMITLCTQGGSQYCKNCFYRTLLKYPFPVTSFISKECSLTYYIVTQKGNWQHMKNKFRCCICKRVAVHYRSHNTYHRPDNLCQCNNRLDRPSYQYAVDMEAEIIEPGIPSLHDLSRKKYTECFDMVEAMEIHYQHDYNKRLSTPGKISFNWRKETRILNSVKAASRRGRLSIRLAYQFERGNNIYCVNCWDKIGHCQRPNIIAYIRVPKVNWSRLEPKFSCSICHIPCTTKSLPW